MDDRKTERFGRYEILTELGRGAMGIVYKARDPKIDRFVAVKTISLSAQNAEEQREYRERFFHETQAAGRLLHPGIVTISIQVRNRRAASPSPRLTSTSSQRLPSELSPRANHPTILQISFEKRGKEMRLASRW